MIKLTKGPSKNNNQFSSYLFFCSFIPIGVWFFLNLLFGVIFANFIEYRTKYKHKCLTEDQVKWLEIQQKILKLHLEIKIKLRNSFRKSLISILDSQSFQFLLKSCVFLNVICLAIYYDDASKTYNDFLRYSGIFFTIVYNLESVFKVLAFGPRTYFVNSTYIFEFFLAVCYILDTISENFYFKNLPPNEFDAETASLIRLSRIFRLMPLLRLVQYLQGVYKIFKTLSLAFSLLLNLFFLMLLTYFIYAIIGCFFFNKVTTGSKISNDVNFWNIFNAMMTLFKCTTADDWGGLIIDTAQPVQTCDKGCGSSNSFIIYKTFLFY